MTSEARQKLRLFLVLYMMQNGCMDEYNEASNCPALEIKLVPTGICMYCSVGPEKQKLSS